MDKSEQEIHEGTEYLKQLAEEVEHERQERGRAVHDVTVDPEEEEPTDAGRVVPGAAGYARIDTQNSPK
jgi:hypothetical protein